MDNYNNKVKISMIAKKWQEGTITLDEKKEFEKWYNSFDDFTLEVELQDNIELIKDRIFDSILNKTFPPT